MLHELVVELTPFIPVFGRTDQRFVPEIVHRGRCLAQLGGHETQFDKWAYSKIKQPVVDLIDIGEVVNDASVALATKDITPEEATQQVQEAWEFNQ